MSPRGHTRGTSAMLSRAERLTWNQMLAQVTLIDEIAKVFLEEVMLELGLKG